MSEKQEIEWFTVAEKKPSGHLILAEIPRDGILLLEWEPDDLEWRISIDAQTIREHEILKWALIKT
jgi:hypothetical protein